MPEGIHRDMADMKKILIGAHRGAMCHAPENSLAAFEKAIDFGTYRIECDIRQTKDGHLVMMHDASVDRTTDEWSSDFSDAIHTTHWRASEFTDYESNVEFLDTKVQGDDAIVQVRETGHYRNTETGEGNAWTDVPNIWLLHKNTSDNWKIVGALLGVGPKVEATNYDDGS